jgi:hypothetical protein
MIDGVAHATELVCHHLQPLHAVSLYPYGACQLLDWSVFLIAGGAFRWLIGVAKPKASASDENRRGSGCC